MVAKSVKSLKDLGTPKSQRNSEQIKNMKKKRFIWVIKLNRIPYGFFERELYGYFQQFGTVIRVRVARNRVTGNHKGWAFVGFDNKQVAEIAAESMNGYLMFEKRLHVKVLKPNEIPACMLKGTCIGTRPARMGVIKKLAMERNLKKNNAEKTNMKIRSTLSKNIKKLKNSGIEYSLNVSSTSCHTHASPTKGVKRGSENVKSNSSKASRIDTTSNDSTKIILPSKKMENSNLTPKKSGNTPSKKGSDKMKEITTIEKKTEVSLFNQKKNEKTPKMIKKEDIKVTKNTVSPKNIVRNHPTPKQDRTVKTPKKVVIVEPFTKDDKDISTPTKIAKFSPKTRSAKAKASAHQSAANTPTISKKAEANIVHKAASSARTTDKTPKRLNKKKKSL